MLQLAQEGRVDKQAAIMMERSTSDTVQRSAASGTSQLDGTMLAFALVVMSVASVPQLW
jgi:hypothetical protein